MVIKHYYLFERSITSKIKEKRLNKEAWETIRSSGNNEAFSIEKDKEQYKENCLKSIKSRECATIIVDLLNKHNLIEYGVVSFGVGKGYLEWNIKNINSSIYVCCTDFTKEALSNLKSVSDEVDKVVEFDILHDDFENLIGDSIAIMYRVSTEFTRDEWFGIFRRMYDANIKHIIYIPTENLSTKMIFFEWYKHIIHLLRREKDVFCGWMYTRSEFIKFFSGNSGREIYRIKEEIPYGNGIEKTSIFLLERQE